MRRFAPQQTTAAFLFERTRESLGRLYAMHWPFLQPETARDLRRGAALRATGRRRSLLRRDRRLGAGQLVRAARHGARLPLLVRPPELVRGRPPRSIARRARRSRCSTSRRLPSSACGRGGARRRAAPLLVRPRPCAGLRDLHLPAERQRRRRGRRHGHALWPRRVSGRRAHRDTDQAPALAAPSR